MVKRFKKYPFPIDKAFYRGMKAFYNNHECSYEIGSDLQKEWQRGYNAAYFNNRKRLTS